MEGQIDLFTLLSLIVALVAIVKLRSVLGRKTGDDDARIERRNRELEARNQQRTGAAVSDKVVSLPRRDREEPAAEVQTALSGVETEARLSAAAGGNEAIANGLKDIVSVDRDFDPEGFVRGARQAYEMIVTAFAEGNKKSLRDLLSKDVYEGFAESIGEREQRGEKIDQKFVGINKADILEAEMKNGVANITIRFLSQLISATRDKAGAVINGDPAVVKNVTDIWTFSRDISTPKARLNPNWRLIATQDAH
jgi:predicted lipid-binding transport protein (Tim44 family)